MANFRGKVGKTYQVRHPTVHVNTHHKANTFKRQAAPFDLRSMPQSKNATKDGTWSMYAQEDGGEVAKQHRMSTTTPHLSTSELSRQHARTLPRPPMYFSFFRKEGELSTKTYPTVHCPKRAKGATKTWGTQAMHVFFEFHPPIPPYDIGHKGDGAHRMRPDQGRGVGRGSEVRSRGEGRCEQMMTLGAEWEGCRGEG